MSLDINPTIEQILLLGEAVNPNMSRDVTISLGMIAYMQRLKDKIDELEAVVYGGTKQ